jgi:hypothetical protein
MDECVFGDAIVTTELGKTKVCDINKKRCRFIKTHDGNNIIFKPILNCWKKGIRKTLKIELENGEFLICTKNHPILTKRGWVKAEDLLLTDNVLYANADAEKNCHIANINQESIYLGIKLKREQKKNGKLFMPNILIAPQNAYVDAEEEHYLFTKHWKDSLNQEEAKEHISLYRGMTNSQYGKHTISSQALKKNKPYLERVLEIPVLSCQTIDQKTIDCKPIMDMFKKNGQNTKQSFYQDTGLPFGLVKIKDMESNQYQCSQNAYHLLLCLLNHCITVKEKQLQMSGWIKLAKLDWHGGFVMMEAETKNKIIFVCIQKDGQKKKIKLLHTGLEKEDTPVAFINQKETTKNIGTYISQENLQLNYLLQSLNLFRNVCSTKWQKIQKISKDTNQQVYDIEVKDTHCFFANNILVHNCHHASSKTTKEVLKFAKQAYWKYGGSATPYREDGQEMMIQALFGKKLVSISASYLIKHNFIVKPFIFNILIDKTPELEEFNSYHNIYSQSIVHNEVLNKLVIDIANYFEKNGMTTLILVQQYPHGDNLKAIRPDLVFIKGNQPKKQRKQALKDLRDGTIKVAIATTLADEGLDIKRLGCVIVAGGGKSITRVYQRVGRTLRKFPGKDKAFVILFQHKCKFLEKHAKRVCNLLKKEKEFIIQQSLPENILQDIKKTIEQ